MIFRTILRSTGLVFVATVGLSASAGGAELTELLAGTVRDAGGQAMEGVAVSARSTAPETFTTTTVYSDQDGSYVFPPVADGQYDMWAQAVGFNAGQKTVVLTGGGATHDFRLQAIADLKSPAYTNQLNGAEWVAALPEATPADRRMKDLFWANCTSCHTVSFVMQNRFDAAGWRAILTFMERTSAGMRRPNFERPPNPFVDHFRDEFVEYLTKVRGPGESPLQPRPLPRPSGEATRVVMTEYDLPPVEHPYGLVTDVGQSRDWSDGSPARFFARGSHDAEVDANGMVWIANNVENPLRTIARLNPTTGKVKNFAVPRRDGDEMPRTSHGIVIDANGLCWFTASGGLGKINTNTEVLEVFDTPEGMARVGGSLDLDVKNGYVWASTNRGALRFDPKTNTFQEFQSVTQMPNGRTYGVATDSEGNGWWGQMAIGIVGRSDIITGTSGEVRLTPVPGKREYTTDTDRAFYETAESSWSTTYPWSQGPRRLGADRDGKSVWVAASWGDSMVEIDIKTSQVTYHPTPTPYSTIYDTVVDKDGMVWANMLQSDRVARFDPKTKTWVEYQLPTRGGETRYVAVDNTKDRVEVWLPMPKASRMVRLQFRTEEETSALKAQLRTQ